MRVRDWMETQSVSLLAEREVSINERSGLRILYNIYNKMIAFGLWQTMDCNKRLRHEFMF